MVATSMTGSRITSGRRRKKRRVNSRQYCLNPLKPEASKPKPKAERKGETPRKVELGKATLLISTAAIINKPKRLGKNPLASFKL
jgi:hypothetical protein